MTDTAQTSPTAHWRGADRLHERRQRLIEGLGRSGIDGCLVSSDPARTYLSGFMAASHDVVPVAVLLVGPGQSTLLTSPNNAEWASSEAPGLHVADWVRPWWGTLADHLSARGWRTIGFQASDVSVAAHQALTAALGDDVSFRDIGGLLDGMRAIKDDAEIRALARAAAITDQAFEEVTDRLVAGTTEQDLAWDLTVAMRRLGAEGSSVIVASGPNAARPHHAPGPRAIDPGEPVIIDMGARVDGYLADLTRTVWVGEPDETLATIYPIVAEANLVTQAAVRAGVTGRSIDDVARSFIAASGYADRFVHGVGHGVGLEIHEAPSAGPASTDTLLTGHSLTVEPGIYLPGWGGVRVEDLGIVRDDGFDCLSRASKRRI